MIRKTECAIKKHGSCRPKTASLPKNETKYLLQEDKNNKRTNVYSF